MFVELNSTHKIVSLNSTFKALGVEFSFTIEGGEIVLKEYSQNYCFFEIFYV